MQCRLVWTQQMTYVTFTLIPILIFSLVYHTNMKVGFYTDYYIAANIFLSAENIFSTGRLSEHHSEYDHFQQEDDRSTEKVSSKSFFV